MKRYVSVTFLGLLLAGCSGSLTTHRPEESVLRTSMIGFRTASHYDLGKRHLNAGHHGLAIVEFHNELADDPLSVRAMNGLAISYASIGRDNVAAGYWAKALALEPNSVVTLNNLLYDSLKRGDDAAASAFAERIAATTQNDISQTVIGGVVAENVAAALGRPLAAANNLPTDHNTSVAPDVALNQTSDREWQLRVANARSLPEPPIQAAVAASPELDLPDDVRLRISNGVGRTHMARRFATYFSGHGLTAGQVANAARFDYAVTYIFYNPGLEDAARQVAALMPVTVRLVEASQGQGQLELILGADLIAFDERLTDV